MNESLSWIHTDDFKFAALIKLELFWCFTSDFKFYSPSNLATLWRLQFLMWLIQMDFCCWQWMHWWSWIVGFSGEYRWNWMDGWKNWWFHICMSLFCSLNWLHTYWWTKMVAQIQWIIKRTNLETFGCIDSKWLPIHHLLYKNNMQNDDDDFSKTIWEHFSSIYCVKNFKSLLKEGKLKFLTAQYFHSFTGQGKSW